MPDPQATLEQALSSTYRIERELGRGGMAVVYLAKDLKHDRKVALKVIRSDVTFPGAAERFSREIRLAARLQHPHILSVHDSGEAYPERSEEPALSTAKGSLPIIWYTMPFVEGESLRDRLSREGQLPVNDAIRIAREAAQALEYAHQHSVIHRDIKPENILLTKDGSVLVADFGIARAIAGASAVTKPPGGSTQLTETGLAIGTPAYMAPEQRFGTQADARSDIYSLATVFYEMLTGQMVSEMLPRVRRVRPEVSEALEAVVRRGLDPDPSERFASMGKFATALEQSASGTYRVSGSRNTRRNLSLAATGLVLLIAAGVAYHYRETKSSGDVAVAPDANMIRIAVLPFDNLGDSADAYFADGMADAVRGKLTQLTGLQVIARSSSDGYRQSTMTPHQIARELGVRYLLTGTVRWAKSSDGTNRVQVSPELVEIGDAAAPTSRWQRDFDAPMTDVFQVQADIAGQVAQSLDLELSGTQTAQLAARPTTNLDAYEEYLKAEALFASTEGNDSTAKKAIALYRRAIARDSGFGLAWARVATLHGVLFINSGDASTADAEAARQALARAQALAPTAAETYTARASYAYTVHRDTVETRTVTEEGLARFPSNVEMLRLATSLEFQLGHFAAALPYAHQAVSLDPRATVTHLMLGWVQLYLRQWGEARNAFHQVLADEPTNLGVIQFLAMTYAGQGDLAGARRMLAAVPPAVNRDELAATFAMDWEFFWVLDDSMQNRLMRLPAAFFTGGGVGQRQYLSAEILHFRGDSLRTRLLADSARIDLEETIKRFPDSPALHTYLGVTLGILGRHDDAIQEGEIGWALQQRSKVGWQDPYLRNQLARIYVLVGEKEKALDQIEHLLKNDSFISPGWLRIDPSYAALKGYPRFERLIRGN